MDNIPRQNEWKGKPNKYFKTYTPLLMFAKHNLLNQSAKSPKSNSMATSLGANLYF